MLLLEFRARDIALRRRAKLHHASLCSPKSWARLRRDLVEALLASRQHLFRLSFGSPHADSLIICDPLHSLEGRKFLEGKHFQKMGPCQALHPADMEGVGPGLAVPNRSRCRGGPLSGPSRTSFHEITIVHQRPPPGSRSSRRRLSLHLLLLFVLLCPEVGLFFGGIRCLHRNVERVKVEVEQDTLSQQPIAMSVKKGGVRMGC
mmetsp:Transcript_93332/g.194755  ORF Transcript_93332/g.194755 Transcript_93332/m.194755 type:complete len:204 (-) Transcript_93332:88-699(-)